MVQTFQRHAGGHSAIPNDTDHFMFLSQLLTGSDLPKGCGHAGTRMARIEGIVDALLAFGEPAQSPILSKRVKLFPTPGEQFMCIGLIARIPYDLILGGIEQVV